MRISIVGMPASGKTTLADAIAKKLSILHIHLDRFWFEAGGININKNSPGAEKERVRASVREKALAAIATESWVSDGVYTRIQPEIAQRADAVIFLDIPLWRRLFNHAIRMCNRAERHAEAGIWHELAFFLEIVRRDYTKKPKLLQFIREHKDNVMVLKSNNEIREYLDSLN